MAYCGPRGIPHSHFLGGPLEWGPDDREKALWWEIHERQRCPHCGIRPEEFEKDRDAYVPEDHHCRGCEIQAGMNERFEKERGAYRRGTSMRLVKKEHAHHD